MRWPSRRARRFAFRVRSAPRGWRSRSPIPGAEFPAGWSGGSSIRSSPPRRSGKGRAWASPSPTGSSRSTAARSRWRALRAKVPRSSSTCPSLPPIRRRPPRDHDLGRPHRRRQPGPVTGAAPGRPAADGRRYRGDGRLRSGGARADRRPVRRRDRDRHQDAGDGRPGAVGRDPRAPAGHAHPDNHRAWRERAGGSRAPRRGLRLHPEAYRPGLFRGGVVPRDSSARAESQGEGPAAGAGMLRRGTGADRAAAGARAARARKGGIMRQGAVLIVDDELAVLQALPRALRLRMDGVTVDTAHSAGVALDRIAARDYDAIVADIRMPGMDGLALLAEIRTRRPDTPTLMITAHGENDLVVGALRGGACDFIPKPIDRDYFIAALHRAMETREARRRVKEQQLALERHLGELEAIG